MTSISGIGSIATGQYDFTNMTNTQAISAASDLANEGKITEDQFAVLAGEVYSFLPISRTEGGGSYDPLTSTADQNFVQMVAGEHYGATEYGRWRSCDAEDSGNRGPT